MGKGEYAKRAAFFSEEYDDQSDIEFLKTFVGPQQTVLDIPCGSGRVSTEIAPRALHVTAVDREPEMLNQLRERAETLGFGRSDCIGHSRNVDAGARTAF